MTLRQTHTFAVLELSAQAYNEIAEKLRAAGYHHAFDMKAQLIDMHGIAVTPDPKDELLHRCGDCIPCVDCAKANVLRILEKAQADDHHSDGFSG